MVISTAKLVRCSQAHVVCVTLVSTSRQPNVDHWPDIVLPIITQQHTKNMYKLYYCAGYILPIQLHNAETLKIDITVSTEKTGKF